MSLEPGRMLLHYRLVERIGRGGMGEVWRAADTTLDREVAIKILPEAFAADPERLARFEREAKVLASLNHPNIAAVYGLHEDGGVRFLAMELVRGRTLTEEIARGLAPGRVLELALAAADALAAAHRQRVTHRDLKPDNIMIDDEGRLKVLDFGLAKLGAIAASPDSPTELRGDTVTRAGGLLGTVAYMSPEQAQGKPVDPRSDVFSLGIILYEMATGHRPFGGDNAVSILSSILRDTPESVTTLQPGVPVPLDRIVRRCLEKDPGARYADASELRGELRELQGSLASAPAGAAPAKPPAPPLRPSPAAKPGRGRWIAAGLVAALALAALGAFWYQRSAKERWVRDEALPQLEEIVERIQGLQEGRESWDAYLLARKIEAAAPGDPRLEKLWPRFTREIAMTSDPPGAAVTARYYDEPDADPVPIGTTPLEKVRYPLGFSRVRLALAGKPDIDDVIWNVAFAGDDWNYRFVASGELPDGMVRVPAGSFSMFIPGLDHLKKEPMAAFAIDRHEVTNREYKRFVDAGGYADAKYWRQPFVDGGRELPFAEAMARFIDRTGRTGPATWEVGTYPDGRDDYPVSGVSWYEAAAYAEWAGKSLPTIFHWNRVAFTVASARIVPMANLAGSGPVAVGSTRSANRFGVDDLAGNVREWVWNASEQGGERFILGGGWNDPDYALRRRLRAAAVRPLADQRVPLHPPARAGDQPGRAAARHRPAAPRLPRGEAGHGRGLRALPAPVRVRQDAARRADRGREAGPVRRPPEDHLQRGLRRRADDGLPVPAAGGQAALPGRRLLPRVGGDQHPLQRVARTRPRRLPGQERARRAASRSTREPTSAAATSSRTTRRRRPPTRTT